MYLILYLFCISVFTIYLSITGMCCITDAKIALLANGKDFSCQQDGSPQGRKRRTYSGPDLPEVQ